MPYKSEAQRAKMHALEREGKISRAVVDEFDEASKGKKLPTKKQAPTKKGGARKKKGY